MDGVLVVDKPSGSTSFDVVDELRRAFGVKAGHTGTLDPMATGVLPVCLGEATKIAQFIASAEKTYDATIELGAVTDTLDADGQVLERRPVPELTAETLEGALQPFRGTFLQTPPMYSAVKVGGKRLYELARAGETVERAPREVTVHELTLRDFSATRLQLTVCASKGFFVRALAADLGERLGCGAHLVALRRTRSGCFTLADAIPLAAILAEPAAARARLVSMDRALGELGAVRVSAAEAARVVHGGAVEIPQALEGLVRVLGPAGELLAVADAVRGRLVFRRVLRRA
jgi:tRNA pseudouridine55 synthase